MINSQGNDIGATRKSYPLRVAYDAKTFVESTREVGKGSYLFALLGDFGHVFTGIAPHGAVDVDLPLLQRGLPRYLLWQQTWLPAALRRLRPDIFVASNNTAPLFIPRKTSLIAVVYDLIMLEPFAPKNVADRLRGKYRAWLLVQTIRRSTLIITVSRFTEAAINERFPGKCLHVIPATIRRSWYVRRAALRLSQRDPYILIVTANMPHKNVPLALEAYAAFRFRARDDRNLVKLRVVGMSRSIALVLKIAEKLGISDDVIVEPFLSEADLQELYRRALCVFVPSRMEGFGIPLLEAMASGTPAVCSNTWSLPEIGGTAPLYVDPTKTEEMAEALHSVCFDAALWKQLSMDGLAQAELFHPDVIQERVRAFWDCLPASIEPK